MIDPCYSFPWGFSLFDNLWKWAIVHSVVDKHPSPSNDDPIPIEELSLQELIVRCQQAREDSRKLASRLAELTRVIGTRLGDGEPSQLTPEQILSKRAPAD